MEKASGNRRAAPRFTAGWAVTLHIGGRYVVGETVDVSSHGLLFRSPRRLGVGDRLVMDIKPGRTVFFRCSVRIIRECEPRDGQHVYGAQYAGMKPADLDTLRTGLHLFTQRHGTPADLRALRNDVVDGLPE